jgi:hypothetical protein
VKELIRRQPLGAAALVLALVALSAALVVPAFAGKKSKKVKLKNGSVTTAKLADGAVTNPKLGNDAVTEGKIAANAVTNGKIANGSVTSNKLGALTTVQKDLAVGAGPNAFAADNVDCPSGTTVLSGGAAYVVTNGGQDIQLRSSFKQGNGWHVAVVNMGAGAQTYRMEAYCLAN